MRLNRLVVLMLGSMLFAQCSSTDVFKRNTVYSVKPGKIVIGNFDKRSFSIDSATEKNVREIVKFELMKKGYNVSLYQTEKGKVIISSEEVAKVLTDTGSEIFIQGTIVINNIGDAFETESESMISISASDNKGVVCEIRQYSSMDLSSIKNIRGAVCDISSQFDNQIIAMIKK